MVVVDVKGVKVKHAWHLGALLLHAPLGKRGLNFVGNAKKALIVKNG
jgi:hypothetical protein